MHVELAAGPLSSSRPLVLPLFRDASTPPLREQRLQGTPTLLVTAVAIQSPRSQPLVRRPTFASQPLGLRSAVVRPFFAY